jgi:hypothetical protein
MPHIAGKSAERTPIDRRPTKALIGHVCDFHEFRLSCCLSNYSK